MARPLGQVLCNAAGQRPHSRSQPRPARQSGLFGISDNMSYTLHFGADYDETRNEYKMEFCDETLRKYIGTRNSNLAFATRKRIALQFLYGLNYIHSQGFLHRRRCGSGCPATLNISEGVGDENFLGVDALGAAVGEGNVERGGRRGLVHLRSLSENPTGNHPGTLGSGPPSGSRSSLTALTFHYVGPRPTRPTQEDGWMGHPCRK